MFSANKTDRLHIYWRGRREERSLHHWKQLKATESSMCITSLIAQEMMIVHNEFLSYQEISQAVFH